MTEREHGIRLAAINAAYGEPCACVEPHQPSDAEVLFLQARKLFMSGHQCAGWDALEAGELAAGWEA